MTNIDIDPFAAPSPEQMAKVARSRATKSVQSSLFRRLGDRGYGRAGHLSWLLCFAGDTAHAKSAKAREKLAARPAAEIAGILDVVRASAESKGATDEWRSVCAAIVATLRSLSASPASIDASAAVLMSQEEEGEQAQLDAYNAAVNEAVRLVGVGVTPAQRKTLTDGIVLRGQSSAQAVETFRAAGEEKK